MKTSLKPIAALLTLILMGCGAKTEPPQASAPAVGGRPSSPDSPTAAAAPFTLAKSEIPLGEAPAVSFAKPLPEVSGEQYWMTIVKQGEPDSQWGQWQYVSAGSTNVTLAVPPDPGPYEIRLHDGYPKKPFNVVHRVSITVGVKAAVPVAEMTGAPSTEPVAHSSPASEPVASPAASSPAVSGQSLPTDPANPFKGLHFKTEKEVLEIVGPPTATLKKKDRVCWYYDREVPSMGEKGRPELHFMGGEVGAIVYYPEATMSDLIATAKLQKGIEHSPPTAPRPKTFTFEQAFPLASGKTKADVIRAFGEPTMKRVISGKEVWQYDDLVKEAGRDHMLAIQFDGELAVDVQGM